jgi:hypothetical protein
MKVSLQFGETRVLADQPLASQYANVRKTEGDAIAVTFEDVHRGQRCAWAFLLTKADLLTLRHFMDSATYNE